MEPEFRPIPITILDFMAVLIPGCVWLTLFVITAQISTKGASRVINSPVRSLLELSAKKDSEISWLPIIVAFLGAALLIGYVMKPVAMRSAETLSAPFFRLQKKYRDIPLADLRFPFEVIYKNQA